ncbi:MAG TPA: RteC domain-containing protein [Ginsengibacter sp.]
MIEEWRMVYEKMISGIESCWQLPLPETEQVEQAFKIPLACWEDIKKKLAKHIFENTSEEIDFYKNIKPKFTSYIEYLPLIFLALSFLPDSDINMQRYFWMGEFNKLQKFIEKNIDFVTYYKGGDTRCDRQYFLPSNYDLAEFTVSKIYDTDGMFMTSHDHLVAGLLAHEMYHEYVKNKLERLVI